jgi:hypothetical protein
MGGAEASGDQAAMDAVNAVSGETGWYGARVVGDPSYPCYCKSPLKRSERREADPPRASRS